LILFDVSPHLLLGITLIHLHKAKLQAKSGMGKTGLVVWIQSVYHFIH
jgi:hypothetical protein